MGKGGGGGWPECISLVPGLAVLGCHKEANVLHVANHLHSLKSEKLKRNKKYSLRLRERVKKLASLTVASAKRGVVDPRSIKKFFFF